VGSSSLRTLDRKLYQGERHKNCSVLLNEIEFVKIVKITVMNYAYAYTVYTLLAINGNVFGTALFDRICQNLSKS